MIVKLKYPAKVGKVLLDKGTVGRAIGISNSPSIKETFPNISEKIDGWYVIVRFPNMEDCLFDKNQLEFS
jgi:hypothetical protein